MGIDRVGRGMRTAEMSRSGAWMRRGGLLACLAVCALALVPASAWAVSKMPHASFTLAPITGTPEGYVVTVANTGTVEVTGFEFVPGSPENPTPPNQLVPSACAYKGFIACTVTLQPGASFQACYQGAEPGLFEGLIARLKPEGEIYGIGAGVNFRIAAVSACPVAGFKAGSGGSAAGKCIVPKVVGKAQGSAEKAIRKAGCKVGAVKKKHSSHVKKGRVISQGVAGGKSEPLGAKVSLVVSKGK